MRQLFLLLALCVVLSFAAFGFQGRGGRGQAPAPATPPAAGAPAATADPYAYIAAAGTTQFPLAALAGVRSELGTHTNTQGKPEVGPFK